MWGADPGYFDGLGCSTPDLHPLSLSLLPLSACNERGCHDTAPFRWLVVSNDHAERLELCTLAVDADGVGGSCTWMVGEPWAEADCTEMPVSVSLDVAEAGVERPTVDDTQERVSLVVSRDGETLFEQTWSPDYVITDKKKPGCGQDGLRGDLSVSF